MVQRVVTSACSCGETLTFLSLGRAKVQVACPSCGRLWLMKRAKDVWTRVLVSETPEDKPEDG